MVMSIISIVMLAVYGADVISAGPQASQAGKTGFLPMDASTRGSIFGIIPSAMLIASFFITRKEPSNLLGILLIIGGGLIIVGTGVILAMQGNQSQGGGRVAGEFGAVVVIGIVILVLGGIKIKKSRKANPAP
ncbi:MAG: hypothetical protein KGI33_03160 [Thaumarchaeota archaeon]|nr:hypothetical protein [Nitrososphaerota archaeon]